MERIQPQLLSRITKGLDNNVPQILMGKPESITSAMRAEYEAQRAGCASDALMATADDFNKEFCYLLKDLLSRRRAKCRKKTKGPFQQDDQIADVKKFRKDLVR